MDYTQVPTEEQAEGIIKQEFTSSLTRLYAQDSLSDLTIICGSRTYKVHKAILCPRSAWFEAACRRDGFREGSDNVITIEAASDSPGADNVGKDFEEAVAHMIYYFYHMEYKVKQAPSKAENSEPVNKTAASPASAEQDLADLYSQKSTAEGRNLTMHAHVYSTAVKYGVAGLEALAAYNFDLTLSEGMSTSDFAAALSVVFTTTAPDKPLLKDLLTDVLADMVREDFGLVKDTDIATAINNVEGLALELLERCRGGKPVPPSFTTCSHARVWECPGCRP